MTPSVVALRAINIGDGHEFVNYDVSFPSTLYTHNEMKAIKSYV